MKFQYIPYSTRIWIFSFLVGPLLLGASIIIEEQELLEIGEIFGGYLVFVILGGICSSPAYGLLILVNELIFQNVYPNVLLGKIFLTILSSGIVFALFYVFINFIGGDGSFSSPINWAYGFAVIFGIWRYEPIP